MYRRREGDDPTRGRRLRCSGAWVNFTVRASRSGSRGHRATPASVAVRSRGRQAHGVAPAAAARALRPGTSLELRGRGLPHRGLRIAVTAFAVDAGAPNCGPRAWLTGVDQPVGA